MPSLETPILMFTALMALYSPLASLSAYFPILRHLDDRSQAKLSVALFAVVTLFALTAIWLGEPLLELLGLSPAALTVTGGIALLFAGIPMMRGLSTSSEEQGASAPPGDEHNPTPATCSSALPVSCWSR